MSEDDKLDAIGFGCVLVILAAQAVSIGVVVWLVWSFISKWW